MLDWTSARAALDSAEGASASRLSRWRTDSCQACRVADVVAELDEAPLTVKESMGQQVISPFVSEARA